ncbi:hypothetical protein T069G_06102 [Trichoderma breve]|uniref:ERF1 methyltransferase catalytic subunit MTQ2 n=1 Tax=Trichoderma breve TaxID=2034170 RepID=A0A9W9BGU3_9HYPO|nr:hypothetical protein T069G_06102 [Trichoderma breve]KAJ4861114.1 hypothetical protein T069G_06102 [Trichoderma breve]
MLPTPDTSHVPYERVYEPAEDSFLLLDTLSSSSETQFLHDTFSSSPAIPFVVELGTGSGVVLAFITAHAKTLFGTSHILTAGVDMNAFACRATITTVAKAQADSLAESSNNEITHGLYLGSVMGDLAAPLRNRSVDVLVFNPPYTTFDDDSYLLALSYAGGADGMETTDRLIDGLPEILSERGCAYVLLCAQNKPEVVKERIRAWGDGWRAETVGSSGKTAGWEKLQIVRIWRDSSP